MHEGLRRVILGLALTGMLVSVFWEQVLVLKKMYLPSPHHGTGSCPLLSSDSKPPEISGDDIDESDLHFPDTNSLETLTEEELSFYDGSIHSRMILIGLNGFVFDVSGSRTQYEGSYRALAGQYATRAISLSSLKQQDMSDNVDNFSQAQHKSRRLWTKFFLAKYPVVARRQDNEVIRYAEPSCAEGVFSEDEVASSKNQLLIIKDNRVFDVSGATWLYGPGGVRYRQSPPNSGLYPVSILNVLIVLNLIRMNSSV